MPPMTKEEEIAIIQHIGKRLRAARQLRGYTMKDLASLLDITYQQVQKYEMGINRLSITKMIVLVRALQLEPDYFFKNLPGFEKDELEDLLSISSSFLEAVHVIKHRPEFPVIREVVYQFAKMAATRQNEYRRS